MQEKYTFSKLYLLGNVLRFKDKYSLGSWNLLIIKFTNILFILKLNREYS